MCGRYTVRKFLAMVYGAIMRVEEFDESPFAHPEYMNFNIGPGTQAPIIRLDKNDDRVASFVEWGLVPSFMSKAEMKEKKLKPPFNAKSETVVEKPMFRSAFKRRRCLVPADGFYEWEEINGVKTHRPFYIHLKTAEPFAFAGLWERTSKDAATPTLDSYTVITTSPNALMKTFHHRMPVILRERDFATWLDRDADPDKLKSLLTPFDESEMEAYPIKPVGNYEPQPI